MRSHLKLVKTLSVTNPPVSQIPKLTAFPLHSAVAEYITLAKSTVLIQSISNYLAHVQLYEYKTHTHSSIDVEITANSIFMMVMLEGCLIIYNDADEAISEVLGNSCQLTYLKAGKYRVNMIGGNHQVLLLNIRPEWLISKYGALKELHELIVSYKDATLQTLSLPGFNIGQQLFNSLIKLNTSLEGRDVDIDMHIFVNDCISRYLVKLHNKIINAISQENKAREIGDFITKNFASKIVGDEPALANHFMISTTMLIRLAKLHFGRPLHQHVIELRMLHGLKLLISTQKTVKEISMDVGYDDPKYFGRAFKKRFEITPNELRICVI